MAHEAERGAKCSQRAACLLQQLLLTPAVSSSARWPHVHHPPSTKDTIWPQAYTLAFHLHAICVTPAGQKGHIWGSSKVSISLLKMHWICLEIWPLTCLRRSGCSSLPLFYQVQCKCNPSPAAAAPLSSVLMAGQDPLFRRIIQEPLCSEQEKQSPPFSQHLLGTAGLVVGLHNLKGLLLIDSMISFSLFPA